jgi:hypothetical protein
MRIGDLHIRNLVLGKHARVRTAVVCEFKHGEVVEETIVEINRGRGWSKADGTWQTIFQWEGSNGVEQATMQAGGVWVDSVSLAPINHTFSVCDMV